LKQDLAEERLGVGVAGVGGFGEKLLGLLRILRDEVSDVIPGAQVRHRIGKREGCLLHEPKRGIRGFRDAESAVIAEGEKAFGGCVATVCFGLQFRDALGLVAGRDLPFRDRRRVEHAIGNYRVEDR
jgi:hypothetical protein